MRILTLKQIKFNHRDTQLVGYRERVESWISQWTVAGNYRPVCVPYNTDESHLIALNLWKDQLLENVKHHFQSIIPVDWRSTYPYGEDFEFYYVESEAFDVGHAFYLEERPYQVTVANIKPLEGDI
jgi:hypothetical protein